MTLRTPFTSAILPSALFVSALFLSSSASAQIFNSNPFSSQLGGGNALVGAGLGALAGGALGSNLAASNAQQEGTAIGAVLGGLAGSHMANRSSIGSVLGGGVPFGSGLNGRNPYVGAGLGAIAGGVLGSNLAASNAQQEGTALGAVLGGVAGYALSNRKASRYGSYGNGYQTGGYQTGGYQGGGNYGQNPVHIAPRSYAHTPAQYMPPMPVPQAFFTHNTPYQYAAPQHTTTQYTAPQYTAPQYTGPQHTPQAPVYHSGSFMTAPRPFNIGSPTMSSTYYHGAPYQARRAQYVEPIFGRRSSFGSPYSVRNNAANSGLYCYANSSVKYNFAGRPVCR